MSLTSFILKTPLAKTIGTVTFDAFINETHSITTQSTDFPIETGATISDHIIINPKTLRVTAFKSSLGISVIDIRNPNEHIIAFEDLDRIVQAKQLVTVVTGLKIYQNMQIENITVSRTAENGNSLSFDIDLKELRLVGTFSVPIPNSAIAAGRFKDSALNKSAKNVKNAGTTTSGQNLLNKKIINADAAGFRAARSGVFQ